MWETDIRLCYQTLSKNQKKAADLLLADPARAGRMTVRACAAGAGVGQATVLRMLQAAGYEGWAEFQQAVWKEEPVDVSSAVFCIIRNIRQKLRKVTKKEYIQTVWGVGYKFVDVPGE